MRMYANSYTNVIRRPSISTYNGLQASASLQRFTAGTYIVYLQNGGGRPNCCRQNGVTVFTACMRLWAALHSVASSVRCGRNNVFARAALNITHRELAVFVWFNENTVYTRAMTCINVANTSKDTRRQLQ